MASKKIHIPVLESVRQIIPELKHVSIDYGRIKEQAKDFAENYGQGSIKLPKWEDETFGHNLEDLELLFLFNTINFAYNDFSTGEKFETFYEGKKYRGAMALSACLRKAYIDDQMDLFKPEFLENLDKETFREITSGNMEIPMLDERLKILNEVGKNLKKYGKFRNLCREAKFKTFDNGKGIVERLVQEFPSFNDVSILNGKEIKFYKRAQLAMMMAYGRFQDEKDFFPMKEEEIAKLTVAADYVLPKSLRALGILHYDKSLERKVDSQIPLEHDSREEIEIRAATVYSCELLKRLANGYLQERDLKGGLNRKLEKINVCHVDSYLWYAGRNFKDSKSHLCRTTDY